jgi:hypothetical protein
VDESDDVGVLKLGGKPDLAQEPLGAEHGGKLGAEDLERHEPVVPKIACEIDRGHAAAAELALEHVAVSQVRLELIARIAHPGTLVWERPY